MILLSDLMAAKSLMRFGPYPRKYVRKPLKLKMSNQRTFGFDEEKLATPVFALGFDVYTTDALEKNGIATLRDLLMCNRKSLLSMKNFSPSAVDRLLRQLLACGINLD